MDLQPLPVVGVRGGLCGAGLLQAGAAQHEHGARHEAGSRQGKHHT